MLVPAVTATLNAAFQSWQVPKENNDGLLTPVFKKGASLDTGDYRLIAETQTILRLDAEILSACLLEYTEAQGLRAKSQTGFRPVNSMVRQLFALQHCIDMYGCSTCHQWACCSAFSWPVCL